jgi:hypothetical protein
LRASVFRRGSTAVAAVLVKVSGAFAVAALIPSNAAYAEAGDIPWVWFSSDAPLQAGELAVLTESLAFPGDTIEVRRRMRALPVDASVKLTPTVHVHLDLAHPQRLGPRHVEAVMSAMREASRVTTSNWVQLDFEALDTQRSFYVDLIRAVRAGLPPSIKLSVTVRAGWCNDAALLDRLAADEIVPMFFRMGDQSSWYRDRLNAVPESLAGRCRGPAAGFAMQERMPKAVLERYRRRYWFNYENWRN